MNKEKFLELAGNVSRSAAKTVKIANHLQRGSERKAIDAENQAFRKLCEFCGIQVTDEEIEKILNY